MNHTTKDKVRAKFKSLSGEYLIAADILGEMLIPGVVRISYRYLNGKQTLTLPESGEPLTIPDLDLEADPMRMMSTVFYATKTNVGKFFIAIFEDVGCFRVREQPVWLESLFFDGCKTWKPLRKVEIPH
jgi:hypothetical protein